MPGRKSPRNVEASLGALLRRNRVTDDDPGRIGMFDRSRARRIGRRDGRRGIPAPSDAGTIPYVTEVHNRIRTAEYAEGLELHREYAQLDGDLVAAARTVVAYRNQAEASDDGAARDAPTSGPEPEHAGATDGQSDRLPSPRTRTDDHPAPRGTTAPPAWIQRQRQVRKRQSDFDAAKQRLSELASQWLHALEQHRSRVRLAVNRYEELLHIYRSAVLQHHPDAATLKESWELPDYQPTEQWMTEDPAPPSRVAEPEVAELLAWTLQHHAQSRNRLQAG